jgi:carboxylate-amine ligase
VNDWARWNADPDKPAWTVGIEEEVMLLDPESRALAHCMDDVRPRLSPKLAESVSGETHSCTLELATGVHATVGEAARELMSLRTTLAGELERLGVGAAVAGTHPFARGEDTEVSESPRYQILYETMRELARREPTFALHVHVGIPDAELALAAADRLRAHLPLILAVSANSPYWRARDSGMASYRTPLFQGFPRSGIPRRFGSYAEYARAVDVLLRADAFPEPTFIWWDVRLQPRFGTVEVRVADAQTRVAEAAAIAALIQALVRMEATDGYASDRLIASQEVLEENRFLAARDGMDARLVDVRAEQRVAARDQLADVLAAAAPHADDLGCGTEFAELPALAAAPGAARQRLAFQEHGWEGLVASMAAAFLDAGAVGAAAPNLSAGRPGPVGRAGTPSRGSP